MLPARNSFPLPSCAESLPRLMQLPLSPLPCQAEPFHTVQAPAEQRLLHFRLRLPISLTWGHGSRISCITPVESQHEAVQEASIKIWTNRPIEIWTNKNTLLLTMPVATLIPIFLPLVPSFAAPGVGSTLIRACALRHYMSPRPQTFWSRPIAPCVARDPQKLSVQSSAPVAASVCKRWGRSGGGRRRRRRAAAMAAVTCWPVPPTGYIFYHDHVVWVTGNSERQTAADRLWRGAISQ